MNHGGAARGQSRGERDHDGGKKDSAAEGDWIKCCDAVELAAEELRQADNGWQRDDNGNQAMSAISRTTSSMTLERCEPSARRTPISRVRCSVE